MILAEELIYQDRPSMTFWEASMLQKIFESNLVGTDGTLEDLNSAEYALSRGIMGEAQEALDAIKDHGLQSQQVKKEIADIFIFLGTLINKVGMTQAEVEYLIARKMMINFIKYKPENIDGRTVAEGMAHSRDLYQNDH